MTAGGAATTVSAALQDAARRLDAARTDAPRIVAEALLEHVLSLGRAQLLARPETPLSLDQLSRYQALVGRCTSGEPLAYVIGHREFYALDFVVDPRVLIPRPETELLVETAIRMAGPRLPLSGAGVRPAAQEGGYVIADVGTGSGAIAVALAVHLPFVRVVATDISPDAIAVASQNARRHGVTERITFKVGNLLESIEPPVDLLAANLPYVRTEEWKYLARPIRDHEPAIALDGGPDGMHVVSRLLHDAPGVMRSGGSILVEIGASQGIAAAELARDSFPDADISVATDHAGLDRLLVVRTPL
ncbi:MAG TPA: peptide chain release factor N(5)-glutamine methyltransferase [Anaerolineae bacterium]|nr:peptide chain release factor N(5)-glutamine methyltransferase [Anaerolineae bacterium]